MRTHLSKILYIAVILLSCASCKAEKNRNVIMGQNDSIIVVAHRGGADLGPENTLECIGKGIAAGADWIEIDVHLSADGKIVVCHDASVDRTTNGKGWISQMPYEDIRKLKVKDKNGDLCEGHIPTLDEVLNLIKGKAHLLLEIKYSKHSREGIEEMCLKCIEEHQAGSFVTIQSFDDSVLKKVHDLNPDISLEKLFFFIFPDTGLCFDERLHKFSFDDYSHVKSFNVWKGWLKDSLIKKAHDRGKQIKAWTVNDYDPDLAAKVDGIITNSPDLYSQKGIK